MSVRFRSALQPPTPEQIRRIEEQRLGKIVGWETRSVLIRGHWFFLQKPIREKPQ